MPNAMKKIAGSIVATKAADVGLDLDAIKSLMEARGIDTNEITPETAASRFVRFIASTEDVDGIGDVVKHDSWDLTDWLTNPAMFVDHDQKVLCMIARGLQAFVDTSAKALVVDCFFLPASHDHSGVAEACYKLVRAGLAKDCSIGAVPMKAHYATKEDVNAYGPDVRRVWDKSLLKELSLVGIGMNSGAKVAAVAKSFDDAVIDEKDLALLSENECGEWSTIAKAALYAVQTKRRGVVLEAGPELAAPVSPTLVALEQKFNELNAAMGESIATQKKMNSILAKKMQETKADNVIHLTIADAETLLTYLASAAEIISGAMPESDDEDEDEDLITQDEAADVGEIQTDCSKDEADLKPELQRLSDVLASNRSSHT